MKIFICNGRGGAGKSTMALALINHFSAHPNNSVLVVDANTQLLDVASSIERTQRNNIGLLRADLRDKDGWIDFLNNIESIKTTSPYSHAIVSLPGGELNISKYAELIRAAFAELAIEVIELFAINRDRESVRLFELSQENGVGCIAGKTVVVKNGVFGWEQQFEHWNASQAKVRFQPVELFLQELFWKTIDHCRDFGLTFDELLELNEGISSLDQRRIHLWLKSVNWEFDRL